MYENWDTETLVKSVHTHAQEIKRLTEVADEMKDILRERLPFTEEDGIDIGDYKVTVNPTKRFNAKKGLLLANDALSKKERTNVVIEAVDAAKFKVLYPELYAQAQDEGKATVRIKEAE